MNKEFNENNVKSLSEKEIAYELIQHLQNSGYKVTNELVLNDSLFDIPKLVGRDFTKVRIDIAAHKDEKVIFIEIENGLWLTHPQLYRNLAHLLFLAYPAYLNSPTDNDQLLIAQKYGIGIISVTINGSIKVVLQPVEYKIHKNLSRTIISLIDKKSIDMSY